MSTYWERFSLMNKTCGPPSWPYLFTSKEDIQKAKEYSRGRKDGTVPFDQKYEDIKLANLHPQSHEVIPFPFNMASHVPVNSLLLFAMLTSKTVLGTGLTQFANQAFNALQAYSNKNITNHVSDSSLLTSFIFAATSSVVVASSLRHYANKSPSLSRWASIIPFLGAAAAKPLQISVMRQDEMIEGISVEDSYGNAVGNSIIAGRYVVATTILTRILYLSPMLWIDYFQKKLVNMFPLLSRNRTAYVASYILHAGFNSAVATPLFIALFDQRSSLPVSALEEEFASKTDSRGYQLDRVYFNKGI